MRSGCLLLGVLLISFNLWALPKASDFKNVDEDETATSSDKSTEKSTDKTTTAEDEKSKLGENEEVVSGTVRVIRRIQMTEVFFKDLKDSYFIPSGSNYSSIYKACQESEKKGAPVGMKVNTKSRRILSLEQVAPTKSPATGAGGVDATSSSGTSGNK